MIYQSGYLTIKAYDKEVCLYKMCIRDRYETAADLTAMLNQYMEKWELHDRQKKEDRSPEERFAYVIERACTLTGKQVVVLIDEYDKPLRCV